ncbi:MAG TPA: pyridoxamine 5'-phosphate oxidase family protein [Acidimicrobiales bacterium]|nr:pyridoxamine 5'-phosphate oxidase family protein [Acidimicrobiales bacterium]
MSEPKVSRPKSPDFMARGTGDLLAWSWAQGRLESERHYWVATVGPYGRPHVRPVWGAFVDDRLYLSVGAAGFRQVDERRDVSVHVDSGVDVVIIDGVAERVGDQAERRSVSEVYNPKYGLELDADFVNFRVSLSVVWGWRDGDVNTATKWTF